MAQKVWLAASPAIKRLRRAGFAFLVVALALIEVPVFLVRRRAVFRNDLLYPFWNWSFGHTVAGVDFASRLYFPERVSLLYIPHPASNVFVADCFGHNVDAFTLPSLLTPRPGQIDQRRLTILRWWLLVIAAFRPRLHVIEHLVIYDAVSLADGPLRVPNAAGTALEIGTDWTGYVRLLRDGVGRPAVLPESEIERCVSAIEARHPRFFERPFVTLLLRTKDAGGPQHTDFRNSGPPAGYRPAVKWLCEAGFNVVGSGETDTSEFVSIEGFYSLTDCDLPPDLLSVFLLTRAALFVGQQSGGHVLPNAAGVPCLLVDAMPYRLGTFSEHDLIVFKPLLEKSGRELSFAQIFGSILAYGAGFEDAEIEIGVCSAETILAATQEVVSELRGNVSNAEEHASLLQGFRLLVKPDMPLFYSRTRPTLHELRRKSDASTG